MEQTDSAVDPDDLPYRNLWDELGLLGVYTDNTRHLAQLGAPTIGFEVFLSLRDYARAESIEAAIRFGAGATILLGFVAIRGLIAVVVTLARSLARLPPVILLAAGALAAVALLDPRTRRAASNVGQSWLRSLKAAGNRLSPGLDRIAGEYASAVHRSHDAWLQAERRFPVGHRQPSVRSRARAICAAATGPVPEVELERRIRADGLVTRGRDFRRYLRRVLRGDPRLQEVSSGVWRLTN